jgi:hypothetical protein
MDCSKMKKESSYISSDNFENAEMVKAFLNLAEYRQRVGMS